MDEPQPISYAEFGHNFIRYVVSADRIRLEIETILKSMIEGSVKKFPANLLVASYAFQLRDVTVTPLASAMPRVSYVMTLEGDMRLDVKFMNVRFRFTLDVRIRLHLDVFTYAPLMIRLMVNEVGPADVETRVDGQNAPAEVVEQLRIVGPIVRDEIVREVNLRLSSPELIAATHIDVLKIAAAARLTEAPGDFQTPLAAVEWEVEPTVLEKSASPSIGTTE